MIVHHDFSPCQGGDEPFDAYEAHVDDLYAEACGRLDAATLLAIEVLFEDAAEIGGAA